MSVTFYAHGTPIPIRNYEVGQQPDGSSWAYVEADDDVLVTSHDRVDVCDDYGRRLWTGVVRRVHHTGGVQRIDINDLTAVTMAHRVTKTGEPDPHFRYGDVVRSRTPSFGRGDLFMVVGRRLGDSDWDYSALPITGRLGKSSGETLGFMDGELELAE